jgi:hypothetical protein
MIAAVCPDILGTGIYTIPEASFYARVPAQTVSRWMFGDAKGSRVLSPTILVEKKLVTFLDFVQVLAIRAIRIQKRVPLKKIRQAVELAEETLNVDYPFARKHTTFLGGGDEIVIKMGDDEYVEAPGLIGAQECCRK